MTRRAWLIDLGLAVLAVVLGVLSVVVTREVIRHEGGAPARSLAVDLLVVVAAMAPLALRRRFPLAVLLVVTTFAVASIEFETAENGVIAIGALLALATAAAHGQGRWRLRVMVLCVAAFATAVAKAILIDDIPDEYRDVALAAAAFTVLINLVYVGSAWVLGATLRTARRREEVLLERTRELEVEREENARRAVTEERVRIARELHDVVAHHVSVMGIQAGAARRVLDRRPERASEALATIEASSRQTVQELQRILGILRTDADTESRTPQPSLAHLSNLIDQVRAAGMQVDLVEEGAPRPLPPGVDLSAYRIVQEALTNVRKHAGVAATSVAVRYRPDGVELRVTDDGRGAAADRADRKGNGLEGMRERAALVGGELSAGPRRSGGFVVRAWLPTGELVS